MSLFNSKFTKLECRNEKKNKELTYIFAKKNSDCDGIHAPSFPNFFRIFCPRSGAVIHHHDHNYLTFYHKYRGSFRRQECRKKSIYNTFLKHISIFTRSFALSHKFVIKRQIIVNTCIHTYTCPYTKINNKGYM